MTRKTIYAPGAELDVEADALQARADEARAKAKRLRWLEAPEWANCIAKPSIRAIQQLEKGIYPPCYASDPQHADDWRWARRCNFGWVAFDADGTVRSAAEAGAWTLQEFRP